MTLDLAFAEHSSHVPSVRVPRGIRDARRTRPPRATGPQRRAGDVRRRPRRVRPGPAGDRCSHLPPSRAVRGGRSGGPPRASAAPARRRAPGGRRCSAPPDRGRLRAGLGGVRRGPDPSPAARDACRAARESVASTRSSTASSRPPSGPAGSRTRGSMGPRARSRTSRWTSSRGPPGSFAIGRSSSSAPGRWAVSPRSRPTGAALGSSSSTARSSGPAPWPRRSAARGPRSASTTCCLPLPASSSPWLARGTSARWTASASQRPGHWSSTSHRRRPCRPTSRPGSSIASCPSTTWSWAPSSGPRIGSAGASRSWSPTSAAISAPGSALASPCR